MARPGSLRDATPRWTAQMDGHPILLGGWTESRLQVGSPSTRDFVLPGLSSSDQTSAGSLEEHPFNEWERAEWEGAIELARGHLDALEAKCRQRIRHLRSVEP